MIRELEKLEIGRPSTYASLLNRVKEHKYLEVKNIDGIDKELIYITGDPQTCQVSKKIVSTKVGTQKSRLVPTETGIIVNDFLNANFPLIVDYTFTRQMEADLDRISNGQASRQHILSSFWIPFNSSVKGYLSKMQMQSTPSSAIKDENGIDTRFWKRLEPIIYGEKTYVPYQGKTKVGKCIRLESGANGSAPIFLDWKPDEPPNTNQILKLLESRSSTTVGEYQIRTGKYGRYIEHNGKKYSIENDLITSNNNNNNDNEHVGGGASDVASSSDMTGGSSILDTATIQSIIQARERRDEGVRMIDKYKIAKGPYGPYIIVPPVKSGGKSTFVSIDKAYHEQLDQLTVATIEQIISAKFKTGAKAKSKMDTKPTTVAVATVTDAVDPKPKGQSLRLIATATHPKPKTKAKPKAKAKGMTTAYI